ncbi:MAG: class I SAM-dependent methyltransferase [Deltaproteobacteria bacterium]
MSEKTLNTIPSYHFDALKQIEDGYWWFEGRLIWAKRFIRQWLESLSFTDPIFYVDLGCGTGGFGSELNHSFPMETTLLVDNSPEALQRIPENPKIQKLAVDLTAPFTLPFKPNLITCMDVIEHLKDDTETLKSIYNNLKPNGLFILSVPAHSFLYSAWDKALGHYRRYNKWGLIERLENTGFTIRAASYGWSFLFPAAPYRFFSSKTQEKLEYPKVSPRINQFLIKLAQVESKMAPWVPYPFGTSIFIAATKESK